MSGRVLGMFGSSWLRLVTRVSAVVLLTLGGVWSTACGSDDKPAPTFKRCTLNSECDAKLVCSFGLCHKQCEESKDCGLGQLCVKTDTKESGGVCQIEAESGCKFADDCPNPLVCGPDSQCRTPCRYPSARDCLPNQLCAKGGVCANPDEVDKETGGIKGAPAVDAGPINPDPDGGDSCTPGGTCTVKDKPCKSGTYVCQGSTRVCQESGNQTDGTQCGVNLVCAVGECIACVQDEACTPDETNPCKKGFIDCKAGRVCTPGNDADDGTECGAQSVCVKGSCEVCTVGEACQPDANDPCVVGKMACSAGPVCEESGNAENGSSCSASNPNRVCASGSCVSCSAGSACEPENVCHRGTTSCSAGPTCPDSGQNAANGKACGSGNYCVDGECKACANGNPCVPTTTPCKKGSTVCSGGQATCNATSTNADDGTECEANSACYAGVCTPLDRQLTVKTTTMPTGPIEQQVATPVVVVLKDKNGVAVPNIPITVTPPPGAFGTATVTNAQGESSVTVRLGRAVGAYQFSVSGIAVQQAATFTINATAPADKTIYSIVNADHTSGATAPGAGAVARIQAPRALAAAADGTLYIGDQCTVYKLSPAGQLTVVAGKPGTCSQTLADGGQATEGRLYYVRGLALDETNKQLYILDNVNNRVRVVDLNTNVIGTLVGGGSATTAPFGVPGPSGNVVLASASGIALSPTGDLYVFDTGHSRILKVNTQTGATTQFATSTGAVCTAGGPIRLYSVSDGSSMAWDKDGKMFISAYFCGVGVPNYVYGVVRVEADGSFTHVAGSDSTTGSKSDGVPAQNAYLTSPPRIAFDGVGNLYVSVRNDHVVRRIDAATYRITTVAGAPATNPVVYGDYGAATTAQLAYPEDIIFDAQNNLHIIDTNNDSVRSVWKAGSTAASSYAFTISGGTGQNAVAVDNVFDTVSVKLVDGANANVLNVPVTWTRKDLGSTLAATIVPTNAIAGISANNGRVGLMPGPYRFDATYSDVHGNATTRTFTVTAVAPAAGTIFTIVNTSMVSANTGVPGPGTVSQTSYTHDMVAASDGTLYLANYCSIEKLSPAGEISRFAGLPGSCAQAQGDGGPALDARFYYVKGLALDETNKLLYVSDTAYNRIRVIDLQTNIVNALAGGGTATAIPWGDGPSGSTAVFGAANNISLGSGGKLYAMDSNHNRIRVVDVNTTGVSTWYTPDTANCAAAVVYLASIDALSDMIWLPNGDSYISGRICGTSPGNGSPTSQSFGIVRRSAAGVFTHIAGLQSTSATSDGIDANKAYFPDLGGMALDSAGNIYIAVPSIHKVRKITVATGKITTVAGNGTSTSTGPATDYIAGALSTLENPQAVAVLTGGTANPGDHLIISDYNNYAFREVW